MPALKPSLLAVAVSMALAFAARGVPAAQAPAPTVAPAEAGTAEPQFVYRFRVRDTLIGLSQRLLLQPRRWAELQQRNGIRNPTRIAPDTPIRIPWSWLKLTPDTAVVQSVTGAVTRDGVPVAQGDVLSQGMRIETPADGSVSIVFADQSVVTLQKSSVLRLERLQRVEDVEDGHSAGLKLDSGRIETTVKPKRDVGRFEIVTPVAISAVRGTQFRTGFDGATGGATTETLEGNVGVAGAQGSAAVGAGFGTRVESSGSVLPPVPLLPPPDLAAIAAVNDQPRLRIAFPAVAEAASYRAQLAADQDFRTVSVDAVSAAPAFDMPVSADGGYWLRVRAIDARGIEGRDATRGFTQHVLPAVPVAMAPAAGSRFHTGDVTLQWAAQADAARYHLQLARDAQFGGIVVDQTIDAGTQAALRDLAAGVYFWRVSAVNAAGESGPFSAARQFERRPAALEPQFSLDKARTLHFTWAARPGERYHLQVARDAAFSRLVADTTLDGSEFVIPRAASGMYHARLQVIAADGIADPAGTARQFLVPVPRWLEVLIGSTMLLPMLL
ncbi:MAG: FecR domain-containing protein [Steroidobacteraceae bacterium]